MSEALLGYYDYDVLRLRYRANAAPAGLGAYILYEDDREPGKSYRDDVPDLTTFDTTWAEQLNEGDPIGGGVRMGCNVTGGGVWIVSSATSLVKGSMYVRLLVRRSGAPQEECLCCGYVYDAKPFLSIGEHGGLEMSEAVAEMDVTLDQGNVAGGAVIVDITAGAGSSFELLSLQTNNGGTNTIQIDRVSGTTSLNRYANIASGAATSARLPSPGAAANTSNNIASSYPPLIVAGTTLLTVQQTGAGAQGDDFVVRAQVRVKGALPTVTKARSTNQADVTVASGALSFAFVS